MLTVFGSQTSHSQGLGDPGANQKGQSQQMVVNHAGDLKAWRGEIREKKGFSKRKVGDSSRSCLQLDGAVSSFSPRMWTVWKKSQEETSMELGMGMESGPLHSCQVLIRERRRGQIRSSEEPWKGKKRRTERL